ncbi:MAG: hypothetical protein PHP23_12595 [Desulfobacterales bacterium]|nr:hypothetical protein [Desulfobacterales bacterium]MDD4072732.1 hypothetical protein [Desulfobacterales bacterium]MDD4392369.1 hypothetical protein [Desulfobacterales bacterium]
MFDLIKKSLLTGIGMVLKTKDEVEELAKDLIQKGKLSEKDGREFLNDLMKKYDEATSKFEGRVETTVKDFLKKADIVTMDELNELKTEISELKKAIHKNNKKPE